MEFADAVEVYSAWCEQRDLIYQQPSSYYSDGQPGMLCNINGPLAFVDEDGKVYPPNALPTQHGVGV